MFLFEQTVMETSPSSFRSSSQFEYFYDHVSSDLEPPPGGRPSPKRQIYGQGAFFNLVNRLHIPIIRRNENSSPGQDHIYIGQGRSYAVTQPVISHTIQLSAVANVGQRSIRKHLQKLSTRRYVTKRVLPLPSHSVPDVRHLAAITNEVRILGNETIKTTENVVRLIAVAWDETPGPDERYWPRLLLEAADYGNLAQFLATNDESRMWKVKSNLIIDVASGVKMLHNHGVAHCDLKLDNILVFRSERSDQVPFGCEFQAKVCDFGFSVIVTDYEEGTKFAAKAGTEPWNAPELTFGTEISISDLPKADIYSLSLLCSRVFMEGGNPFTGLTMEDVRALKQAGGADTGNLKMYEHVASAIFDHFEYTENQQLAIRKLLLTTLLPNPEHRFGIEHFAPEFLILSYIFDK